MSLRASWARTAEHLKQAAVLLEPKADLAPFRELLDHNELELAADCLSDLGEDCDEAGAELWRLLGLAYEEMKLTARSARCRARAAAER